MRVLYSIIVVVTTLLIGLGAYWGYLAFYKNPTTSKKSSQPGAYTQTNTTAPQLTLGEKIVKTKLPQGWEIIRCGEPAWFANPKSSGIDCAKATSGDSAITLFSKATGESEKKEGLTIIKASDAEYLFVTLKKSEYQSEYNEIVKALNNSVAVSN